MSMYGHGTGWGVALMAHTLTLVVGGVSRSPAVVGAEIVARERVCLTLTFDHDVIDGAPAARFARRLIQLIESGAGLQDQAGEPGYRDPDVTFGPATSDLWPYCRDG